MEAFGSLIIGAAREAAVPAGSALAVDRDRFAARCHRRRSASHPLIELRREEVPAIPARRGGDRHRPAHLGGDGGPLQDLLGSEYLYFYDAIAPIVDAESLDFSKLFWQSRYGKGEGDDYLNAPLNEEQYLAFHQAAVSDAEVVVPHEFEKAVFFEGCLPIEELARRGVDTLRYGPMKPVGLRAPGRPAALGGGSAAAGEPGQEPLQPGGLPVAHEVGRAAARAAA